MVAHRQMGVHRRRMTCTAASTASAAASAATTAAASSRRGDRRERDKNGCQNTEVFHYFTTWSNRPVMPTYVPRSVVNVSMMLCAGTFIVESVSCSGASLSFT